MHSNKREERESVSAGEIVAAVGLKHVKTNYALILNPDVICDKDFFKNIEDVVSKAKDFTIIGCQYLNDKVHMPAGFFNKNKNE